MTFSAVNLSSSVSMTNMGSRFRRSASVCEFADNLVFSRLFFDDLFGLRAIALLGELRGLFVPVFG
jgi:hypothetical protein